MDTTSNTQPSTQAASPNSTSTRVEPLEALVQSVVSKYQNIEILHPFLQKLFDSSAQKELFTAVTQHDYNQLMTRSQKLEDHEVNVYEKAFCVLMEREEDRIGGLEIYLEKILGVGEGEGGKGEGEGGKGEEEGGKGEEEGGKGEEEGGKGEEEGGKGEEEREAWMLKGVAVRALLERVSAPNPTPTPLSSSIPQPSQPTTPTHPANLTQHAIPSTNHPPNTNPNPTNNPHSNAQTTNPPTILTNKLLPLYRTARKDFDLLPALDRTSTNSQIDAKTTAAKFLRDTVENCIQYLTTTNTTTIRGAGDTDEGKEKEKEKQTGMEEEEEGGGGGKALLRELRATLSEAKGVAEEGSGGRKRRFDLVGGGGGQWAGGWEKRVGRGGGRGGGRGRGGRGRGRGGCRGALF